MAQETISGSRLRWGRVWTLGCFLLATLVAPVGAEARSYKVIVTSSEGPLSGTFLELMTMQIAYSLDSSAPDSDGDPDRGVFAGTVLSLSLDVPGIRASVVAGSAGTAQTFDNAVDEASELLSDQVFFIGGPISSSSLPGGEQVTSMEVDFLSDFVAPPAEPKMLDGDALPTYELRYAEGLLILETSGGTTTVRFEPVDSIQDSGCAIGSSEHSALGGGWLVLLPALLLWGRRHKARGCR